MAVTVKQSPSVVLDAGYRIVEVAQSAEGGFGPLAGQNLWECFPGAEPLFRPYYDRAWRTGRPEEFVQYYDGHVVRVHAERRGELLEVSWRQLHMLDPLTLETLETSLARTIELVDDERADALRSTTRAWLRLVPGGA